MVKTHEFQKQLNRSRILFAIREAERRTSGEIRVYISTKCELNPVKAAQKIFLKEKMDRTRERNGVLLYIAPQSQNYAVIGDVGIHQKVGESFWQELVQSVGVEFKKGCFTEGIVQAIEVIGDSLSRHFPCLRQDKNEQSDELMGS